MPRLSSSSPASPALTLSRLRPGQKGLITALEGKDSRTLHKLMAMGILPGMTIKVVQNSPSWVVQLGYTQLTFDNQIAGAIQIHVTP
ncbi:MAG: ferrous iron transport protein A [Firmicutes bacterium]|nr:ferrous iron transport protein A [Bacillota bacterium]